MRLYFLTEQSNNEGSGLKLVGTLNLTFCYLLDALKQTQGVSLGHWQP